MKIPVTLNGEKIILDENGDETLLHVLRKKKFISCKTAAERDTAVFVRFFSTTNLFLHAKFRSA